MLVIEFDPDVGWSDPIIKPYSQLSLDPSSSVFHYAPAVFEGMKAFRGIDGRPRLFRPEMNMERMERSADRVALPVRVSRCGFGLTGQLESRLTAIRQRRPFEVD